VAKPLTEATKRDYLLDASSVDRPVNAEGVCKFQPRATPWETKDPKSMEL